MGGLQFIRGLQNRPTVHELPCSHGEGVCVTLEAVWSEASCTWKGPPWQIATRREARQGDSKSPMNWPQEQWTTLPGIWKWGPPPVDRPAKGACRPDLIGWAHRVWSYSKQCRVSYVGSLPARICVGLYASWANPWRTIPQNGGKGAGASPAVWAIPWQCVWPPFNTQHQLKISALAHYWPMLG